MNIRNGYERSFMTWRDAKNNFFYFGFFLYCSLLKPKGMHKGFWLESQKERDH
jgi:hypothetical protein